jgi:hypothetical protein
MNRLVAVATGIILALAGAADALAKGAGLEAALVRCVDVTYPVALATCGTDPLGTGKLEVKATGDLEASVTGALPNATYDILLGSIDGSSPISIAVLSTDGAGNGQVRAAAAFDLDQAGVVALGLVRNSSTQFVAGFLGERKLEADLVPCGAVNVPLPLGGCGTDALRSGEVKIEDGDVRVDLNASPLATYQVVLRPLGAPDVVLGTLTTNNRGKGQLRLEDVVPTNTAGVVNVVLRRDMLDQFVSGFQSTRKRPPLVAKLHAGLVRCASVNTQAALADCGGDQITKGEVLIDEKGDVNVHLHGVVARAEYEVFLVAFDATSEVSLGTLTTNPAGNGHVVVRDAFPVGTRAAGSVVVKRGGIAQYVTGFVVVR